MSAHGRRHSEEGAKFPTMKHHNAEEEMLVQSVSLQRCSRGSVLRSVAPQRRSVHLSGVEHEESLSNSKSNKTNLMSKTLNSSSNSTPVESFNKTFPLESISPPSGNGLSIDRKQDNHKVKRQQKQLSSVAKRNNHHVDEFTEVDDEYASSAVRSSSFNEFSALAPNESTLDSTNVNRSTSNRTGRLMSKTSTIFNYDSGGGLNSTPNLPESVKKTARKGRRMSGSNILGAPPDGGAVVVAPNISSSVSATSASASNIIKSNVIPGLNAAAHASGGNSAEEETSHYIPSMHCSGDDADMKGIPKGRTGKQSQSISQSNGDNTSANSNGNNAVPSNSSSTANSNNSMLFATPGSNANTTTSSSEITAHTLLTPVSNKNKKYANMVTPPPSSVESTPVSSRKQLTPVMPVSSGYDSSASSSDRLFDDENCVNASVANNNLGNGNSNSGGAKPISIPPLGLSNVHTQSHQPAANSYSASCSGNNSNAQLDSVDQQNSKSISIMRNRSRSSSGDIPELFMPQHMTGNDPCNSHPIVSERSAAIVAPSGMHSSMSNNSHSSRKPDTPPSDPCSENSNSENAPSSNNNVVLEPLNVIPIKAAPSRTAGTATPNHTHEEGYNMKIDLEEEKRRRVLLNDKLLHDKLNQGLAMNHKYNNSMMYSGTGGGSNGNPFAQSNRLGTSSVASGQNPFGPVVHSGQYGRLATIGIADPSSSAGASNGATMHKFSLWKGKSKAVAPPEEVCSQHPGSLSSSPGDLTCNADVAHLHSKPMPITSNTDWSSSDVTPTHESGAVNVHAPVTSCSSSRNATPSSGSKMASKLRGITSDNVPDLTDRIPDSNSGASTPIAGRGASKVHSHIVFSSSAAKENANEPTVVMKVLAHSFSMAGTTSALQASSSLVGKPNSGSMERSGNVTHQLAAQFDRLHRKAEENENNVGLHPDGSKLVIPKNEYSANTESDSSKANSPISSVKKNIFSSYSAEEDDLLTEVTGGSKNASCSPMPSLNLRGSSSDEYEEDRDSPALSEMSQSIEDLHQHMPVDGVHQKDYPSPNRVVLDSKIVIPMALISDEKGAQIAGGLTASGNTNMSSNAVTVSTSRKPNPFALPGTPKERISAFPSTMNSNSAESTPTLSNPFARRVQQSPLVNIKISPSNSVNNSLTSLAGGASSSVHSATAMMMLNSGTNNLAHGMFPHLSTNICSNTVASANGNPKPNVNRVNNNAANEADTNTGTVVTRSQGGDQTNTVKWKKGKKIGEGSFGCVFQGMNIHTGELLAIKQLPLVDGSKEEVGLLEKEIEVMWDLEHVNIVK